MALHSLAPRKRRQPARARQIERSIRRSVVSRNMAHDPVSGVFRTKFEKLGAVLLCAGCAGRFGGAPVSDARFDFRELECFVCSRSMTNRREAA